VTTPFTAPTSSERAALLAISQPGATYASAARALGISKGALGRRLERLYRRLNVTSAAQAHHALLAAEGEKPESG